MVTSYLDNCDKKEERFKNNLPGEDWLISFKRRWQDHVRLRKPEVLTKARAKCLNEETVLPKTSGVTPVATFKADSGPKGKTYLF